MKYLFCIFLFLITPLIGEENEIIVCDNGVQMVEWDLEFIRHANKSIEISGCFTGGKVFQDFADAIEKRMEEVGALEVYLLTNQVLMEPDDRSKMAHMLEKFKGRFHLQETASVLSIFPTYGTTDNHAKFVIIDEKYFSGGGTNLVGCLCSDGSIDQINEGGIFPERVGFIPSGARDQDIVGKGPIAKEIRVMFYKLFALWESYLSNGKCFERDPEKFNRNHYQPIDEAEKAFVERFESTQERIVVPNVRLILGGPMCERNPITNEYKRLIDEAKEEVVIGNFYLSPATPIFEALMKGAQKGLEMTYITNGCRPNSPYYCHHFSWASRVHYVPLLYGREYHLWESLEAKKAPVLKTRIYEYNLPNILYHKKTMVVDQRYVVIGSYNLGSRSDKSDYEIIFVIDSEKVAKKVLAVFEKDKKGSIEVTPEEARSWYFDFETAYLGALQKQYYNLLS